MRGNGWEDAQGSYWVWQYGIVPGGCDHWDVEHDNGDHSNISPEGQKHHGFVYQEYF